MLGGYLPQEEVWAMELQKAEHGTRGGVSPPAEEKGVGTDCSGTDMGSESENRKTEKQKKEGEQRP